MNHSIVFVAASALSASIGCSGVFDDLADEATGDSVGQPEPANGDFSETFPFQLLGVSGSEANRAFRFVASGLTPPSLTTFEYSLDGSVSSTSLVIADRAPADSEFFIATSSDAEGADGLIAVSNGTPIISLYDVGSGTEGPEFALELRANQCIGGMMLGPIGEHMLLAQTNASDMLGGIDERIDLITTAGPNLVLFQDIDLVTGAAACFSCKLELSSNPYTVNSIAEIEVANLNESAIVVALRDRSSNPPQGSESRVDVFTADQIRLDDGAECFRGQSVIKDLRGPSPNFGTSIAVGDFDNDDVDDVAFGNPEESEVIVINGLGNDPAVSMPDSPIKLEALDDDRAFGATMTAADIDKDDGDELLVSDHQADRDGVARAGIVHVFKGDVELNQLADSTPEEDQDYGVTLTDVEYPTSSSENVDLAIVGASGEIFTYFALENADDPR